MAVSLPRRLFMVSGPAASRAVSVTFDDGPHPEHTPALLDRLRALDMRATFFVVGRHAERHPEIVRRMAAEGHEVGHHSYTHGDPVTTSAPSLVREVWQGAALLGKLLGRGPRLFRPPHGELTLAKTVGIWAARQTIVLWNKDPKDFACGSAAPLRSWFSEQPLQGGDILLLHDVHAYAAEALDALAARAKTEGLGFCTPLDWVNRGRS